MDVVCAGTDVHGVAALESLVQCSGGCVSVVPSFGTEFQHDLLVCLTQQTAGGPHTANASSNSTTSATAAAATAAATDNKPVRGCVIDVRTCTQGSVVLQHVVGPAAVTEEHDEIDAAVYSRSIAAAAAGGHSVSITTTTATIPDVDNLFRLLMGRQDPYSTLALYFSNPTATVDTVDTAAATAAGGTGANASGSVQDQHTSTVQSSEHQRYVHIQFVVRFMQGPGQHVTRVITHRYVCIYYSALLMMCYYTLHFDHVFSFNLYHHCNSCTEYNS
jgi:hypothetical protein